MLRILTLAVLLPMGALAQNAEIFIPGADTATLQPQPPKPANRLAGCLANPTAQACAGVDLDPGGLALESATGPSVSFETLVLDLGDDGGVTASAAPPAQQPDYSAPPPQGKVALPSVAVTIEFDYDSAGLRADQIGKLVQLTAALQDPALVGTSYAVIGHTDGAGSDRYNCQLSQRRAAEVTRLLQGNYVQLPLYAVGFGEHVLKNTHDPRASENRRVTFLRLPDAPGAVLQTANEVCAY